MLLGVLIVLSAPLAAGSSIIWTRLSGGNTVLTTVVVLASMGLAPLVMPALIAVLADSAVEVSATELIVELAAIVLAGGVLAYVVPEGSVSEGKLDGFSVATIGVLIYAGVGGSTLSVEATQLAVVGGIAVATIGLSAAVAYGLYARGMQSDDCVTVLFSSSMKNMSVSVMVGAVVGGGTVVASITAFYVVQQVVSSSLVRHLDASVPSGS
ncbi:putative Na+-dependent transporter [Natronococcus occultus SP4]|uniref:Putative Na+-dependent transporter n=2 Tax=Natronococcus occultus TaxID=29288 RepID=L0JUU3_9EURY|nr:putative Na+-dependent transporter [Natronococcus occultus SP4]